MYKLPRKFVYDLLRKSERYTRTDMVYLAGGGFWLSLNQVITIVLALVSTIFLANFLSEDVFGTYRYVISFAGILAAFSLTGLNYAITRNIARGLKGILLPSFRAHLLWSMGTIVLSLAIGIYYYINENIPLSISFVIVSVMVPLTSSGLLYGAYLEGKKDFKRNSIYNSISIFAYTFFLFIAAYLTNSLIAIVFAYFTVQAVMALYFFFRTVRRDKGTDSAQHTVSFSKHLSVLNIFSILAAQLDKVLIFQFIGAGPVAIYALSQLPVSQMQAATKQISRLAFPKFAANNIETIKKTIYRKMYIFTLFAAALVALYIISAPFIFNLLFPKYPESVILSQIAVLAILFSSKKLVAMSLIAHASKKIIYAISLINSFFKITALIILLPLLGIWGAVLAELFSQGFNLLSSLFFLYKTKKIEKS